MSVAYGLANNVNQGYTKTANTITQISSLLGGSNASKFDLSAIKVVKGFTTLGAAASTSSTVYANTDAGALASSPNTILPTTGLQTPQPLRLGEGDVVLGFGLLSASGTISSSTTTFQPATGGNVSGSSGLVVTAVPTFTAFTYAQVNAGALQLNAATPIQPVANPAQTPTISPSVNVAPYVLLQSGGVDAADVGKKIYLTFLIINLGATSE